MSIERRFEVSLIAEMALREKQIQQNYRPIIGVHKWFARRPGTLFRGLLLAEFGERPFEEIFFQSNDFPGLRIADPFMGGGTPLLEANRIGCDVEGFDINPMSAWIVREEIEPIDLAAYEKAARALIAALRADIDRYYRTSCPHYGDPDVPVKSFLWVKVLDCESCGEPFDLFPGYLIAENRRHPKNVLVCPACGDLNEVEDRNDPGNCASCTSRLHRAGPARRGRCECPNCGHSNAYPGRAQGPLGHRLFAIEYHNPHRKAEHKGRFFKKPDAEDLARADDAAERWTSLSPRFVPDQTIPPGRRDRPVAPLGLCPLPGAVQPAPDSRPGAELPADRRGRRRAHPSRPRDEPLRSAALPEHALPLRHDGPQGAGHLLRARISGWAGAVRVQLHGHRQRRRNERRLGGLVEHREQIHQGQALLRSSLRGPANRLAQVFGFRSRGNGSATGGRNTGRRRVTIRCESATESDLAPQSLDAVFTDPPYFGNVQYGELMDFCYVWLRRLVGNDTEGFDRLSTRSAQELTGNTTQERDLAHFTEGLSCVYSRMARALKPGAPLAFTYHHNKLDAYCAVGVAILDAGLVCSASLPCPAEMGGSIHIHGTTSSIIDTVFVCRTSGAAPEGWRFDTPERLAAIVGEDSGPTGAHRPNTYPR